MLCSKPEDFKCDLDLMMSTPWVAVKGLAITSDVDRAVRLQEKVRCLSKARQP